MQKKHLNNVMLIILIVFFISAIQAIAQGELIISIQHIEGQVRENGVSYDVETFLTVTDGNGNPITNLTEDSFSVYEDSRKVEIALLEFSSDEPTSVVLVLDTRGSMGVPGISAARESAIKFVEGLGIEDEFR